jgi:hypothetical protein
MPGSNLNESNTADPVVNQHHLAPPPSSAHNIRRASDGGSNISLFSQFYSLKSPFLLNNNTNQLADGSSSRLQESNASFTENYSSNNNDTSAATTEESSETCSNGECGSLQPQMPMSFYKPRGSITSGIPIINLQLSNNQSAGSNNHSSEEEEEPATLTNSNTENNSSSNSNSNYFYGDRGTNGNMKYQRKNSKTRHEPYLDALSSYAQTSTPTSQFNLNGGNGGKISPAGSMTSFRNIAPTSAIGATTGSMIRQRKQSYGDTNSTLASFAAGSMNAEHYASTGRAFVHRASEPVNQLELICAHM